MIIYEEDGELVHYGTPRHSGRYPWGSGGDDEGNTRNRSLVQEIKLLRSQGMKDTDIAKNLGMKSTTQLRAEESIAKNAEKQARIDLAQRLADKGNGPSAISRRMGIPESTVRSYLAPGAKDKADVLTSTANMLKQQVAEKKFIDIGTGVELGPSLVGVSSTRLATAAAMLESEGYKIHSVKVRQVGRETETTMKVLGPPGSTQKEVWQHPENIQLIDAHSGDGGRKYRTPYTPPLSLDSKRVGIKYKEDGGDQADGVIFVRPGVKDVSLGGNPYAQVRILVDGTHYIKGMAVYKDDLPAGKDIVFNTNKSNINSKKEVLKPITDDPKLPFGSIVRQIADEHGKPTSAMNIVNDEGDWAKWSKTLSSQMLSKQSPKLAKQQLDLTYERHAQDFENIKKLTNPTVRKKMLEDFAGNVDSAAVHLKAAALPRQQTKVILPLSTIKETEVYAPGFRNGEKVALVRHPHGGPFEIPELTVNNRNIEARRLLGDGTTAIGIHHKVAKVLSGADFDGDTVLVIPDSGKRIKTERPLKGLKDFDPVSAFPGYPGMKPMKNTQAEMGAISNLITDMSIKQAPHRELERAVKHSMVVIDAEKKNLDYKESYRVHNIKELKDKYQLKPEGGAGAATLISKKKSIVRLPEMKPRPYSQGGPVNVRTGEKEFVLTNKPNYKTGEPLKRSYSLLGQAKTAHSLSSGTPIENLYADHSDKLKSLANQARLEAIRTPNLKYSPSARKTYKSEVDSLNSKLTVVRKNAPLERQANAIANSNIKQRFSYNPNLEEKEKKKIRQQEITEARIKTGAGKEDIEITPKEWDAIQAGAISNAKLSKILLHAKPEVVRALATPKTQTLMTPAATERAKSMFDLGYTREEVAAHLGVSLSTLDKSTSGESHE